MNNLVNDRIIKRCHDGKKYIDFERIVLPNKRQNEDVEFIKQVPAPPRDRLKRRKNTTNIRSRANFIPKDTQLNASGRYLCKRKARTPGGEYTNKTIALEPPNKKEAEVEFIKQGPLHPRERYKRRQKQLKLEYEANQEKFKKREPSYLKWPKIVCDEEFLKEVPEFNFKIKVYERDKVKRREEIFDKIIKQIPDNDKYYISYEPKSNSYLVAVDTKYSCAR